MVSVLTRIFGIHNLELAEDVVQDTLLKALQKWSFSGIPDNPSAWLFKAAKNKAIDTIRREKFRSKYADDLGKLLDSEYTLSTTINELFLENEIKDDQLRMIFTCCHPAMPVEAQLALTLKTLCGFSVNEIARAFLTSEATISKRLYRARQKIKEEQINFEIPPGGKDLGERMNSVLAALYLLFNEGYNTTQSEKLISSDLIAEAVRLCQLLTGHPNIPSSSVHALLALMHFHMARIPARTDAQGNIILLKEQDHSLYDRDLLKKGIAHLQQSGPDELSSFHIEAGIAFYHSTAESFEKTDWNSLLELYDLLYTSNDSPVVALNRAIVIAQLHGPEAGIAAIEEIKNSEALKNYFLLPATLGEFYFQAKKYVIAEKYITQALPLTSSIPEKKFLENKLEVIRKAYAMSSFTQQ
jgi:RNA polymerase sigma factor (sigma-70 family)